MWIVQVVKSLLWIPLHLLKTTFKTLPSSQLNLFTISIKNELSLSSMQDITKMQRLKANGLVSLRYFSRLMQVNRPQCGKLVTTIIISLKVLGIFFRFGCGEENAFFCLAHTRGEQVWVNWVKLECYAFHLAFSNCFASSPGVWLGRLLEMSKSGLLSRACPLIFVPWPSSLPAYYASHQLQGTVALRITLSSFPSIKPHNP